MTYGCRFRFAFKPEFNLPAKALAMENNISSAGNCSALDTV